MQGRCGRVLYFLRFSLKGRPLFRHEKTSQIGSFKLQKPDFCRDSARIARQAAARAHYPVARDDDGNGIMPHRSPTACADIPFLFPLLAIFRAISP